MSGSAITAAGYMMKMPPLADKRAAAEALCSTCSGPIYSQGLNTFQVPMALFEVNRAKVVQSMLEQDPSAKGLILLEGGKQTTRYDTDHEPVFRQESYFHYLFGASQYSDCFGTLSLPDGEATLFVPTYGIDVATVCGASPDFECVKVELGLENVYAVDDLKAFVEREMKRLNEIEEESASKLYLLKGLNTDSGNLAVPAYFKGIEELCEVRDEEALFRSISECRVFKSSAEIDIMRYTNWVSSMAHVEVMRATRPGMMEYQLESLFQHHTYTHGGCRHMSYTCICACGPSANSKSEGLKTSPIACIITSLKYSHTLPHLLSIALWACWPPKFASFNKRHDGSS